MSRILCLSQGLPKMELPVKATKEVEIKGHGVWTNNGKEDCRGHFFDISVIQGGQQGKVWQNEQQGRLASGWGCFDTDLKKASEITLNSTSRGKKYTLVFTALDYRKLFGRKSCWLILRKQFLNITSSCEMFCLWQKYELFTHTHTNTVASCVLSTVQGPETYL